jgi:hypothetical protein
MYGAGPHANANVNHNNQEDVRVHTCHHSVELTATAATETVNAAK